MTSNTEVDAVQVSYTNVQILFGATVVFVFGIIGMVVRKIVDLRGEGEIEKDYEQIF